MKYEGIVKINNEQYHAEKDHISSSNLKSLLKDPALFYKEKILGDREPTPKSLQAIFDDGTLAHTLILEPSEFEKEFRVYDGFRKQGKAWEAFKADPENAGYILLSKSQKSKVEKWVKSYIELPTAVNLVKDGFPEHTLFGELMGVSLKVRADWINVEKGYIADVKTTSSPIDVDSFKYVVESFSYDLSAALYSMMFEKYYGKPFEFYFIVLGKRYANCEVYKLSEASMAAGKARVVEALNTFKKCKESGIWELPNYLKIAKIEKDEDYEILEV